MIADLACQSAWGQQAPQDTGIFGLLPAYMLGQSGLMLDWTLARAKHMPKHGGSNMCRLSPFVRLVFVVLLINITGCCKACTDITDIDVFWGDDPIEIIDADDAQRLRGVLGCRCLLLPTVANDTGSIISVSLDGVAESVDLQTGETALFNLQSGTHTIRVMNENGQGFTQDIEIPSDYRYPPILAAPEGDTEALPNIVEHMGCL